MISKIRRGLPNQLRRMLRSPFRRSCHRQIVHCAYHKMGTRWLTNVLSGVADHYGMSLQFIDNNIEDLDLSHDIVILNHSDLLAQQLKGFVGSHMLRDLRDVVVSGYYYHLWTTESWAHQCMPTLGGLSYQNYLKRLSLEAGVMAEIRNLARYVQRRKIRQWNFDDPRFHELRYEQMFGDEDEAFAVLFEHYGFTSEAIENGLRIAKRYSFGALASNDRQTRSTSHLRSGKSGQWEKVFSDQHKSVFKELLGDVLIQTGYETNFGW